MAGTRCPWDTLQMTSAANRRKAACVRIPLACIPRAEVPHALCCPWRHTALPSNGHWDETGPASPCSPTGPAVRVMGDCDVRLHRNAQTGYVHHAASRARSVCSVQRTRGMPLAAPRHPTCAEGLRGFPGLGAMVLWYRRVPQVTVGGQLLLWAGFEALGATGGKVIASDYLYYP
jgi:hypothetical protein